MTTPPTNLRQFPARVGAKAGIAIDLDHLRAMMEEFLAEMEKGAGTLTDWKFEAFLQWAANKQKEQSLEPEKRTPSL